MCGLRAPNELDLTASNVAAAWQQWRRDWGYYAAARELHSKSVSMQVGTFFNCAGPAAQEVASHFAWVEDDGLEKLLDDFDSYCNPRRNIVRERFEFYSRDQQPRESITSFLATLRKLVSTSEFPDTDSMVRDRLCMGSSIGRYRGLYSRCRTLPSRWQWRSPWRKRCLAAIKS